MARSKNNKAAPTRAAVDVGSTGVRTVPKGAVAVLIICIVAAVWAVAMMTGPGRVGYYILFEYLKYYMGVVALVSLSITIMIGLVATDRLVLGIRQRVLLQSAHRTTGVIAVGGLFVHVWTKVTDGLVGIIDVFIPFLVNGWIGMGTISGWVMVLVMWSGLARAKFIGRGKPWMWRGLHAVSYLIWPIALLHGLGAGRPAATWVIVSYILCVVGVIIGLAVRLSVSLNRRKDFASPAGVGAVRSNETGTLVPTATAPIRRPGGAAGRRAEPAPDLLAPAGGGGGQVTQSWSMDAPPAPPVPPPAPPAPEPLPEPVAVVEEEPRGRRQPELEAPAPRQRRAAEDDERYETQTRMSRRDVEDDRYRYDDEPAPRSRGGRSPERYDEPAPRGRRYEDDEPPTRSRRRDDLESTSTRMRRDDLESTSTRMRRDDLESPSGRMRRYEEEEPTGARMRRDDLESPSGRMRRYEEDDAPRSRRREPEPEYEARPSRRRAEDYDDAPRGARSARYEEPRYEEPPPRRPSRSEFVDFADAPADDSPTLVDTGSRRSRRGEPEEGGRGGRRGRDDADDGYFSQLRGDRN
ncbi:translation initiation factor III [Actinoplanes couchii]|uniref:Uncharacterized protein n=1 Tax=Actinoplanes couchii TaxID=403638 RepID=A0ABQ3X0J7_9ACTN|nr:translation initiation factor III [Actinoplanes couchii]MDR6316442.1 hypothetical protein [Actinoplanes couchii]GID52056.1 hypothetical protein Aco03nite_004600 [Actinoplanes couchii]